MQKREGTEDPRVRRTRKMLQQAFLECTVEKGFAAVTVNDITERAMLNRSTFYRHYVDKYDLLEHYINEMYAFLEGQEEYVQHRPQEAPAGLIELLKQVQQGASFYRIMLGEKGDTLFMKRFHQQMEKRVLSCFQRVFQKPECEVCTPPLAFQLSLITSAVCGAIPWWLEQEQPCPPEQLANWLTQFIYDSVVSSLKPKE